MGEQCCLQEELCIGHRCELSPPDDQMGNGSSQSIVLGPPRPLGFPLRDSRFRKGPAKYAHPQNRVLPKPVLGQRLRCTDNGNILHSAGTIRGQKPGSGLHSNEDGNADPEMMDILRRRSEMIERENCYHQLNLRNHRLFHSDPDIARSRPTVYSPEALDPGGQRRSGGGVAMRASRLRYRKKARAPDPPNASSLPRQFERRSQQTSTEMLQNQNAQCRCVDSSVQWRPKTRAPPPPAKVANLPPPPPPLPGAVITRTTESSLSRIQGYEKNMHPLDKWRISRSVGDIRKDEEEEDARPGSRTTVFDSKTNIAPTKKPPIVPNQPDPFQKEIEAVTRKIAESKQQNPIASTEERDVEAESHPAKNSPKQYYFSDAGVVKSSCNGSGNQRGESGGDDSSRLDGNKTGHQDRSGADAMVNSFETSESRFSQRYFIESTPLQEKQMVSRLNEINNQYKQIGKRDGWDEDGEQKSNPRFRERISSAEQRRNEEWNEIHRRLVKSQEEDETDIDIRLRPVLPRKTVELPEFSATEMWQAIGPDAASGSNPSTSEGDDPLESVSRRYNKPIPPKRSKMIEEMRMLDDAHHQRTRDQSSTNKLMGKMMKKNDTHWTPRQDLADDSDGSSIDSEDAVVPRNQMNQAEIPTRFALPTVMFSNMRPIGSEMPTIKTVNNNDPSFMEDNAARTRSRKKRTKNADSGVDVNTLANLKRFLGIRNKYLSEDDISAVDPNWTFGEYELQKKGRHYASDLMLADKKKYELLVRNNFGELLGDILVSKVNDVRNKLKSSNSENSNFSFYSTEGHMAYLPEAEEDSGGIIRGKGCGRSSEEVSPLTKGRVYNLRKKLDGGGGKGDGEVLTKVNGNNKKKFDFAERELDKKRGLELMRVLEDEVRRRRNKEKISIRQQLQMIKRQNSEDEDEDDFDDEAYFTEPKSRDGTQSPQYHQGHHMYSDSYRTNVDSSPLTHWKSSPALLEDPSQKCIRRFKDDQSSSSITSSPDLLDPETWRRPGVVDRWLQRQQPLKHHQGVEKYRKGGGSRLPECETQEAERSSSDDYRYPTVENDISGKGSKSGNHGHQVQHKERRKTNIYKQLMDIVRREERQMNRAEGQDDEPTSRESSYSQRESSRSSSSSPSSESSYSYSDSIDQNLFESSAQSGIPANNEFHTSLDLKSSSDYRTSVADGGRLPLTSGKSDLPKPSFQVAFVQPFSPNKGYRPVPFEVPLATGCRRSGLQEAPHQVPGPVS